MLTPNEFCILNADDELLTHQQLSRALQGYHGQQFCNVFDLWVRGRGRIRGPFLSAVKSLVQASEGNNTQMKSTHIIE